MLIRPHLRTLEKKKKKKEKKKGKPYVKHAMPKCHSTTFNKLRWAGGQSKPAPVPYLALIGGPVNGLYGAVQGSPLVIMI